MIEEEAKKQIAQETSRAWAYAWARLAPPTSGEESAQKGGEIEITLIAQNSEW